MKPGFHCVRTRWNRGFMTFLPAPADTDCDADGADVTWLAGPLLLALLAGPDAGHLARALGGATVDRRLDQAEDRTLKRGGDQDLAPAPVGVGSLGSVVLLEGDLPDLLEDGPGEHAAQHADQDTHRLIQHFAHRSSTARSLVAAELPWLTRPNPGATVEYAGHDAGRWCLAIQWSPRFSKSRFSVM